MGVFSTIASIFTGDIKDNKLVEMVDSAIFTDQEKATINKDLVLAQVGAYKLGLKDNNKTRSITRRWIALLFCIPYVSLVLTAGICKIIFPEIDLTETIDLLHYPVVCVITFYFGGQIVDKLKK